MERVTGGKNSNFGTPELSQDLFSASFAFFSCVLPCVCVCDTKKNPKHHFVTPIYNPIGDFISNRDTKQSKEMV